MSSRSTSPATPPGAANHQRLGRRPDPRTHPRPAAERVPHRQHRAGADRRPLLLPWLEAVGASPGRYPRIAPDAFLDAAVHAADITVDEWGSVAAAATSFGFAQSAAPDPDFTVAADQPFLYLIRHVDSGLVLFLGQVTDPTA